MTWLDISAIVFLVICAAVGARLGSLWIGVCLIGGFFGASLADTYVYSLSEYLGNFSGSFALAWGILFAAGLGAILIPGYLLSKISSVFLTGIIDGAIGLFAGAFTGMVALALVVFFIFPLYPRLEKRPFWKNSTILKPSYKNLESLFEKKFLKGRRYRDLAVIAKEVKQSVFQKHSK